MIDDKKLIEVIKSYMLDADELTCQRIASDVKRDIAATIHSLVRQAVSVARKEEFERHSKI